MADPSPEVHKETMYNITDGELIAKIQSLASALQLELTG